MRPGDRQRLIAAARRAHLDGWHHWEIPGQVVAAARHLGIECSEAQAQRIASAAKRDS